MQLEVTEVSLPEASCLCSFGFDNDTVSLCRARMMDVATTISGIVNLWPVMSKSVGSTL